MESNMMQLVCNLTKRSTGCLSAKNGSALSTSVPRMMALGEQPYISASPTPLANGKELELKYDEFRKSVDDKSIHIHLFSLLYS